MLPLWTALAPQAFVRSLRRGGAAMLRCAPCRALCDCRELLRAPRGSCSLEATRTVLSPAADTEGGYRGSGGMNWVLAVDSPASFSSTAGNSERTLG